MARFCSSPLYFLYFGFQLANAKSHKAIRPMATRPLSAITHSGLVSYPGIETFLGPCACASGYIIIMCSGRRAYHQYSTWSFPGPAKTACPALLNDRATSSMPTSESVSCSLSFARTVTLTRMCAELCAPGYWDTSPESTLIGRQNFGVEDQGMFQLLPDVPSRVGGAAGYETTVGDSVTYAHFTSSSQIIIIIIIDNTHQRK